MAFPAVPSAPQQVAWSLAGKGPIEASVPAGPGVAVILGDRVVALDGRTGKERWHYRAAGWKPDDLIATPDGRTLLASAVPAKTDPEIVGFDATTGRVLFTKATDLSTFKDRYLTNSALIMNLDTLDTSGNNTLHLMDVRTGRMRTWTAPNDLCYGGISEHVAATDTVIVPCWQPSSATRDQADNGTAEGTLTVIGLDARTTTVRWQLPGQRFATRIPAAQTPNPYGPPAPDADPALTDDRGAVQVRWRVTEGGSFVTGGDTSTLDIRTGKPIPFPADVPGSAWLLSSSLAEYQSTDPGARTTTSHVVNLRSGQRYSCAPGACNFSYHLSRFLGTSWLGFCDPTNNDKIVKDSRSLCARGFGKDAPKRTVALTPDMLPKTHGVQILPAPGAVVLVATDDRLLGLE